MFSKISEFSCLNKMPLLSGKMNCIMLSLINSQRYRNEILAAFTWIVSSAGSACSMVDKQTLWSTALLFTKTSFFQTTKTPKIIFENSSWPNLAKAQGHPTSKNKKNALNAVYCFLISFYGLLKGYLCELTLFYLFGCGSWKFKW